jgi:hypothetical protein
VLSDEGTDIKRKVLKARNMWTDEGKCGQATERIGTDKETSKKAE